MTVTVNTRELEEKVQRMYRAVATEPAASITSSSAVRSPNGSATRPRCSIGSQAGPSSRSLASATSSI